MDTYITIGNKKIGINSPVFIIAEIGQNHQGDINIAKQLISSAKKSGANCVKFQKTNLYEKFNKAALERKYSNKNSWGETYGDHKRYLEFSEDEFKDLQTYADNIGILFTASAMDLKSLKFLVEINVPFIKVGSGDANNFILIEEAAKTFIPLVISTGMQEFETVQKIYNTVSKYHKKFVLMQCVSAYPTPIDEINLNVIKTYQKEFQDVIVGYSGHEMGSIITVAAVAMGAKVVERHITLNHNQKGSDHMCSLEPEEFTEMIKNIRIVEKAMGDGIKIKQKSEEACYKKLGKTLVAAKFLKKGSIIKKEDLKIKVSEPKGIDGAELGKIIGKFLLIDLEEDESLTEKMIR